MAAAVCTPAYMKFAMAKSSRQFSTVHAASEATVFYSLALNQPLPRDRYLRVVTVDPTTYLSGDMIPRIVLRAEGIDLGAQFHPDDVSKCLALMKLIHLKAGEPDDDSTIIPTERDALYTNAYCWILHHATSKDWPGNSEEQFTRFVLNYTGFSSIYEMCEFIDVVYIPKEFIVAKVLPRENTYNMGLLICDGLTQRSPTTQKFITKMLSHHTSDLRAARRSGHARQFEESMIQINRLMWEFAPEDSSRPDDDDDDGVRGQINWHQAMFGDAAQHPHRHTAFVIYQTPYNFFGDEDIPL